jgi:hypothetical protein
MSVIIFICAALAVYVVVSYVVGAISYKANGCGLDTLAFLAAPLLLPLVVRDWARNLKYRLFRR